MDGSRPGDGGVTEGHDGGGERYAGDGVEVGEMGENEVDGGEDHDEEGKFDGLAGAADGVVEFLK